MCWVPDKNAHAKLRLLQGLGFVDFVDSQRLSSTRAMCQAAFTLIGEARL